MRWTTMRRRSTEAAAVLLVAAAVTPVPGAAPAAGQQAAAPEAVVHDFHAALAAGDSARALELLHPEVRIFEAGHAETLSEYRAGHLAADMEFAGAVERELVEEDVTTGEDGALYLSEYRVTGTFRGEEVDAHGTETMVLVRTGDGWRIRHVHWSSR